MTAVVLVIHIMVAVGLVATVLLQRSEGGALGIGGGGGGGGGGFLSGRGAANVLTRTTAILAAGFFATSIALSLLAGNTGGSGPSIIQAPGTSGPGTPADRPALPVLPQPGQPQAPISQ